MPHAPLQARSTTPPLLIAFLCAVLGGAWLWWGPAAPWLGWTAIVAGVVLAAMTRHSGTRSSTPGLAEVPGDYRVSDEMLEARFSHLVDGERADEWRAFLAQREPGDQLWYADAPPTEADAGAGFEYLVIVRPSSATLSQPASPAGREVARFVTRTYGGGGRPTSNSMKDSRNA